MATNTVNANIAGNANIENSSFKINSQTEEMKNELSKVIDAFEKGRDIDENKLLAIVAQYPFTTGEDLLKLIESSQFRTISDKSVPLYFYNNLEGKAVKIVGGTINNSGFEFPQSQNEFKDRLFGSDNFNILRYHINNDIDGLVKQDKLMLPNNFYVNEYIFSKNPAEFAFEFVFSFVNINTIKNTEEPVAKESFILSPSISIPILEADGDSTVNRYLSGKGDIKTVTIFVATSEKSAQGIISERKVDESEGTGDTEIRGKYQITYY